MCLKVKIDSFYIIILKKYCEEYLTLHAPMET